MLTGALSYEQSIGVADLKAPAGQFRLVRITSVFIPTASKEYHFLHDKTDKQEMLQEWRARMHSRDSRTTYRIFDDQGRVVDAVGTHITEAERVAPKGQFRVVCVDIATDVIRLVADLDDQADAIDYAKEADQGPYTRHQVHDDTGTALIPVF